MTVTVSAEDLRLVLDQRVQHCHLRDGHWDSDNRPCRECAARGRLYAALGDPCIECHEGFESGDRVTLRSRWIPAGPIHDYCIWDDPPSLDRAACAPLSESAARETAAGAAVSPVAGGSTLATHPAPGVPAPAAEGPSTPQGPRHGVDGHQTPAHSPGGGR